MATADAERDTAIKRATALRESAVAKAQADQERVIAETGSKLSQSYLSQIESGARPHLTNTTPVSYTHLRRIPITFRISRWRWSS